MTRLTKAVVAAAVLGAVAPLPVTAQTSANAGPAQDDLMCLAAMSYLGSMDDESAQAAGRVGTMYFLGKVFAVDPEIDLDTSLLATAKKLDAEKDQFSATLQRCGGELDKRGGQLTAAGKYVGEHAD